MTKPNPQLVLDTAHSKEQIVKKVEQYLQSCNLKIVSHDFGRPWGSFFVIDETQALLFGTLFFPHLKISKLINQGRLSPKILVVEPHKRLSWQYHHRRSEHWRIIHGTIGVATSQTDAESKWIDRKIPGDIVYLHEGERHRLIGLEEWGVVAEIWQHSQPQHLSNEDDIIRLQDDFGR